MSEGLFRKATIDKVSSPEQLDLMMRVTAPVGWLALAPRAEYPRLAGQRSDYLVWAMRQYQMGLDNPLLGRDNAIMRAQVQSLSVSDMQDIAAYLESLPGSLVFKK